MIYLDHNATAPLRSEARAAMEPFLDRAGNASSLHANGRAAKDAIEQAREHVAALVGAREADEIVFTGGGTEADVWALRGVFEDDGGSERDGLVVSAVEHPAVLETARRLAKRGVRLELVPVDAKGRLAAPRLDAKTKLVSVMAANNETGNVHDVAAFARAAHEVGAHCHTDAVQALGKIPVDVGAWDVDLLSASGHKLGGPQGVGFLWIRSGMALPPLLTGGGQERGRRSGTSNTAGIVGLGEAARLARLELDANRIRITKLRDDFVARVRAGVPTMRELGDPTRRLPNTACLAFTGIKGEALLMAMDASDIAVSTGSACSSGSGKPSAVLVAMGVPKPLLDGALRVSLGPGNTEADITRAAETLVDIVQRLTALSTG